MSPAVGQIYDSCDWRTCAPIRGTVIAVDQRHVTLVSHGKRQTVPARSFPVQVAVGRGTRTWRLIGSATR